MFREFIDRFKEVLVALTSILAVGTVGYVAIEGWSPFDALWMTVITLATIGYGEVHPLSTGGRVFTIVLSLTGLGIVAYAFSALTAFIVEGDLKLAWRKKKMAARIEELTDHYIVCGTGFTGMAIVEELAKTHRPFVCIELDTKKCEELRAAGYLVVEGDALEDEALEEAGIKKAKGIFCAIDTDRDNVYITLTARGLNPRLRIVSEVHEDSVRRKLIRSGADAVINSQLIGGLRAASEMLRPAAVTFLDSMIRDRTSTYRFEEVCIPENSALISHGLGSIKVSGGRPPLVVAVREPKTGKYSINPDEDRPIEAGDYLVVIGNIEEVERLKQAASA